MSKKTNRQFTEHLEARLRAIPTQVVLALAQSLPKRGAMSDYQDGLVSVDIGNATVFKNRNIQLAAYIVQEGETVLVLTKMTHAIIHTQIYSELLGRDQHLMFLYGFGQALKALDPSANIYIGEDK